MTDHFVEVPKKVLSPAAQAVRDAFNREARPEPHHQQEAIAAALRAVADQVAPKEVFNRRGMRPGGTGSIAPDEFKQDQRFETRRKILAIATELEGQ
jgi:hypothetical protein